MSGLGNRLEDVPAQVDSDFALGTKVWRYLCEQLSSSTAGRNVAPSELAVEYLRAYLTGRDTCLPKEWPAIGRRFDQLQEFQSHPDRITSTDLVAVSFLSVNIPPAAAWGILNELNDGLESLWSKIPLNLSIESADCTKELFAKGQELDRIWNLLGRSPRGHRWGMGPTKISKLMARKRPLLIPVQDKVIKFELEAIDSSYWELWWEAMHLCLEGRQVVVDFARMLRNSVPEAQQLSLLRVLDIAIWMHGKHRRPVVHAV